MVLLVNFVVGKVLLLQAGFQNLFASQPLSLFQSELKLSQPLLTWLLMVCSLPLVHVAI
jgi:hypothetical protein